MAQSMRAHPTVQYRYIVGQSMTDHTGGLSELNMNGDFTWANQLAGRQDAIDALQGSQSVNLKQYFEEWNSD